MKTGSQPGGAGGEASSGRSHPPPVLLCVGSEKWLRDQEIERLKVQCLAPGFEEMDGTFFSEPPDDPRAILETLRTLPFGSPLRLVVVGGFGALKMEDLSWLSEYLRRPNPKACLILCAERLEGPLPASARLVLCQPLKGSPLKEWLFLRAKEAGVQIDPEAADGLIARLGSSLQPLAMAVESLALLAGDSGRITRADVEALIPPSMRETAFEILDRAAAGDLQQALNRLRQAIAEGQIAVEQMVGALGWYYRLAWKSRQGDVQSGWISPQRQAALRRLLRWSPEQLRAAMEEALKADVDLKLGHPHPELLADQLILRLGV